MKRISVLFCLILVFSCKQTEQKSNDALNSTEVAAPLTPTQKKVKEILQNAQPNIAYSPYQQQKRIDNSPIPKGIEQKLIKQGEEMFAYLQSYDLEALDMYAPRIEEMEGYYKIFDPNRFNNKWNAFQKNYENDEVGFGENATYDQFLLQRMTSRMAVLRAKSQSLTYERVRIDDSVDLDTVYVKQSDLHNNMYDIHIRYKKKDIKEYYEIVNEACWLNDRTCLYTLSWKFLGKYIPFMDKYINSELNRSEVDAGDIDSPLFKKKPEDRVTF